MAAKNQNPKLQVYFSGLYLLAILVMVAGSVAGGVTLAGIVRRAIGVLLIVWILKGILTRSWNAWNEMGQTSDQR